MPIKLKLNSEINPAQEILGLIALGIGTFVGMYLLGELADKIRKMKESKKSPAVKIKEIVDEFSPDKMHCSVAQLCDWKSDKINGGEEADSHDPVRKFEDVVRYTDYIESLTALNICLSTAVSCGGNKGSRKKIESVFNQQAKKIKAGNKDADSAWNPQRVTIVYPSDILFKNPKNCGRKIGELAQKSYDLIKKLPALITTCLNQPTDKVPEDVLKDRMIFLEFSVKISKVFKDIVDEWYDFCLHGSNEQ